MNLLLEWTWQLLLSGYYSEWLSDSKSIEVGVCFVDAIVTSVQQRLWIPPALYSSHLVISVKLGVTEVFPSVPVSHWYMVGSKVFLTLLQQPLSLTDLVHQSFRGEAFSAFLPLLPMNDSQSLSCIVGGSWVQACSPSCGRPLISITSDPGHKWISHPSLGADRIYWASG